jgi:hypothetical protein
MYYMSPLDSIFFQKYVEVVFFFIAGMISMKSAKREYNV